MNVVTFVQFVLTALNIISPWTIPVCDKINRTHTHVLGIENNKELAGGRLTFILLKG